MLRWHTSVGEREQRKKKREGAAFAFIPSIKLATGLRWEISRRRQSLSRGSSPRGEKASSTALLPPPTTEQIGNISLGSAPKSAAPPLLQDGKKKTTRRNYEDWSNLIFKTRTRPEPFNTTITSW